MRETSLKPFKHERDESREYDILRAIIFFLALEKSGREGSALRKTFYLCRMSTGKILQLRHEYPEITLATLDILAKKFDLEFVFWYRDNSKSELKQKARVGSSSRQVHLKFSMLEDFDVISLKNLTFLTELEIEAEPCNFLKSKITRFYSFLHALSSLKFRNFSEEEFFQDWGTFKINFKDEKKFCRLFGFGFSIWCSETLKVRFKRSWSESQIHILLRKENFRKGFINVLDSISIAVEPSILQVYFCDLCGLNFSTKQKLLSHEKICSDPTKYFFKEAKYGHDNFDPRDALIEENILSSNDNNHLKFVSFDIESVNVPYEDDMYLDGVQRVISIGFTSSFSKDKGVFIRKSMEWQDGKTLVKEFFEKLFQLQELYYSEIPETLKIYYSNLKLKIKGNVTVKEKRDLSSKIHFLKEFFKLKVIGFNSGSYDLPCILNLLFEVLDSEKLRVIKRGATLFSLDYENLSFRDALNYSGPNSLSSFAKMFKLPVEKGIFPYEFFRSIKEIECQFEWPSYGSFKSHLPAKKSNHIEEISEILNLPVIFGFDSFGELLSALEIDLKNFSDEQLNCGTLPFLTNAQEVYLKENLFLSPKEFFEAKFEFERKISTDEYFSFLDYLIHYNQLDCDLLCEAMKEFIKLFKNEFGVCLFDKLSLPGIAEKTMWKNYDKKSPKMFSFSQEYGFLNDEIRSKLYGGPTIVFHRHSEIDQTKFSGSVTKVPNGSPNKIIRSYDYNALYAYSMRMSLPTGMPFYYRKISENKFKFELAGQPYGWSKISLDWLNFMSFDERFKKPDGSFYPMICAITGEYEFRKEGRNFTIDGMVETDTEIFFLEFFGCKFHLCPLCNFPSVKNTTFHDNEKIKILKKYGTVIVKRECEWRQEMKSLKLVSPFSLFFYEKEIKMTDLLKVLMF